MQILLSILFAVLFVVGFLLFLGMIRRHIIKMLNNPFEGLGEIGAIDFKDEDEE